MNHKGQKYYLLQKYLLLGITRDDYNQQRLPGTSICHCNAEYEHSKMSIPQLVNSCTHSFQGQEETQQNTAEPNEVQCSVNKSVAGSSYATSKYSRIEQEWKLTLKQVDVFQKESHK